MREVALESENVPKKSLRKCPNIPINHLSRIEDNPEQNSKNERLGLQSRTLRIEVSLLKL